MFAERTQREDVVHFLNSAFACTGQREFYENAHSQRVSIDFLHQYMLVNYRSVYARSLAVGINHYNQSQVILRLLASGKQALPGEGRLIARSRRCRPSGRGRHSGTCEHWASTTAGHGPSPATFSAAATRRSTA